MRKKVFLGIIALIVAFCFISCEDSDDPPPDSSTIPTDTNGKTIKVNGISGVSLVGGSILSKSEDGNYPDTVVAVGINDNHDTFFFFEGSVSYDSEGTMIPIYDFTKPWDGIGDHFIVLSTTADDTGDQYFYTDGEDIIDIAAIVSDIEEDNIDLENIDLDDLQKYTNIKTYNFTTEKNITLDWSKFKKAPNTQEELAAIVAEALLQQQLETALKVSITNLTPLDNDRYLLFLLEEIPDDDDDFTPIAFGIDLFNNGTFTFFSTEGMDDPTPDIDEVIQSIKAGEIQQFEYENDNSYYLVLSTLSAMMNTGEGLIDAKIYAETEGPAKYSFDQNEINFASFVDLSSLEHKEKNRKTKSPGLPGLFFI